MSHPLDGAFLRFYRADAHLAEAQELIGQWEKGCVDNIVPDDNGQFRFNGFPDVPTMLPVVVGDAIHNMRAALDYLIYELSLFDSKGAIKDGTQFIIEDDPAEFERRRKRYLKGLSKSHWSAIEQLQPYNRIDWTETLRDISNPDKHRHLSVLNKGKTVQAAVRWSPTGRFRVERLGRDPKHPTVERFDVEVDGAYSIGITLPKRGEKPLMPTLRLVETEVCGVLELFKPEF